MLVGSDGEWLMEDAEALALAALWGTIHNLRVLVNRGLVSPTEVDDFASAVFEGVQQGSVTKAAIWETALSPALADLKEVSYKLWSGDGQTNPRQ